MSTSGAAQAPGPSSSLTYEPHYGLAEKPFSLTVNPKFLYKSPTHRVAFERLLAGIRRREGLIVLTGEVGTGKTTVCRAVIEALDRRTFSSFIPDPFVTREDLLKAVLIDFGVVSADDIKAGRLQGASRQDLSHLLYEFLHSIAPLSAFAVIVVDEAQNLSLSVLEEIRILTELETGERMLQVVLVGQPELKTHLKLPEMRQLNQRVSVRAELLPLDPDGVAAYITHRIGVAAEDSKAGVTFTPSALGAVWRASAGVPRLVNKICDRSLECGHADGVTVIDAAQVTAALEALELPSTAEPSSGYAVPVRLVPPPKERPLGHPAVPDGSPAEPARPIILTPGQDGSGLDAFASETPAPPPKPTPARHAGLPETAKRPGNPRSDAKQGWLTKLWRVSIYLVAFGGAVATSGVLDQRAAPWHRSLTPLPPVPAAPTPAFLWRATSAEPAPGDTWATSLPPSGLTADMEVRVAAPSPDAGAPAIADAATPTGSQPSEANGTGSSDTPDEAPPAGRVEESPAIEP